MCACMQVCVCVYLCVCMLVLRAKTITPLHCEKSSFIQSIEILTSILSDVQHSFCNTCKIYNKLAVLCCYERYPGSEGCRTEVLGIYEERIEVRQLDKEGIYGLQAAKKFWTITSLCSIISRGVNNMSLYCILGASRRKRSFQILLSLSLSSLLILPALAHMFNKYSHSPS